MTHSAIAAAGRWPPCRPSEADAKHAQPHLHRLQSYFLLRGLGVSIPPMKLSLTELQDIRRTLAARIVFGLSTPGTEIAALPAYLAPPPGGMMGRAVVVDAGGANLRAAIVELLPGGESRIVAGPVPAKFPGGPEIAGDAFFDVRAELVERLGAVHGLPVGYCFSYPSETLPSLDARLLRWTKGVQVAGVEGTNVGELLGRALSARRLRPGQVQVLNDTVASLLGGAFAHGGSQPAAFIGLIVGTGTNMATFLPAGRIPKLKTGHFVAPMAVNLENGNFNPPHLAAVRRGARRDLGEPRSAASSRRRCPGPTCPGSSERLFPGHAPLTSAADLVRLRDEGAEETRQVAGDLLQRSADLVAAGLAAVTDVLDSPPGVGILAEGSLFWGDPRYAPRVQRRRAPRRLAGRAPVARSRARQPHPGRPAPRCSPDCPRPLPLAARARAGGAGPLGAQAASARREHRDARDLRPIRPSRGRSARRRPRPPGCATSPWAVRGGRITHFWPNPFFATTMTQR